MACPSTVCTVFSAFSPSRAGRVRSAAPASTVVPVVVAVLAGAVTGAVPGAAGAGGVTGAGAPGSLLGGATGGVGNGGVVAGGGLTEGVADWAKAGAAVSSRPSVTVRTLLIIILPGWSRSSRAARRAVNASPDPHLKSLPGVNTPKTAKWHGGDCHQKECSHSHFSDVGQRAFTGGAMCREGEIGLPEARLNAGLVRRGQLRCSRT